MVIKALNKIWFWSLLLIFFSCSNDDNEVLFEGTPSSRIEQRVTELQNLLLASPDGYKAVYFTKNDEYGGFTFYMKFNSNGTVEMTSDFDSETAITSSRYEVKMGSTTELVFSSRNHIHKVSDSNIQGLIGSGFEGNSNFQYIKNEGGKITFKEPRHDAILVFEPVTAAEWDNVNISLGRRASLLPTITTSVFQGLTIEDGSGKTFYTFNYDSLRLFANSQNQADDGTVTEVAYGIAYTPEGLVVSPAIEIGGNTYENFVFDTVSESYISGVDGSKATIGFINQPPFINNDIFDIGTEFTDFVYIPRVFPPDTRTSLAFQALTEQVTTNLANGGLGIFIFDRLELRSTRTGDARDTQIWIGFRRTTDDALFWGIYDYTSSIVDKKLVLTFVGVNEPDTFGNFAFFQPFAQPLLDFFGNPEGLYYETTGNFQNFSNKAGTFTSAADPTLRVYTFWRNP
ncbi:MULTISPECIES: DUF4302 domain-containing protein [Aquimarina]|uniref:DUF4302 domain-containing protein n=1 Tax=Aquimarina TaxID=290174 RepID=UPI0009437130|nr:MULTISPECIES: DUF4302 domain-containing protein [Aquimarina]